MQVPVEARGTGSPLVGPNVGDGNSNSNPLQEQYTLLTGKSPLKKLYLTKNFRDKAIAYCKGYHIMIILKKWSWSINRVGFSFY